MVIYLNFMIIMKARIELFDMQRHNLTQLMNAFPFDKFRIEQI